MKIVSYIAIIIICFASGFYLNQKKIKVEYIRGDTIIDSIPYPVPYKVEIPGKPIYIIDTITQKVDTLAIINDWILSRSYKETLFDNNKLGKLDVDFTVQYNQIKDFKYSFTPIHKVQTIQGTKWQFFASTSYSTSQYFGIGGGFFYKKLGIEYQYQLSQTNSAHLLGLKYLF